MTNKDILIDLYTKGINQVAVQNSEMLKNNFYVVYKLNESNIDWVCEKIEKLKYVEKPKGLNTHWFKN